MKIIRVYKKKKSDFPASDFYERSYYGTPGIYRIEGMGGYYSVGETIVTWLSDDSVSVENIPDEKEQPQDINEIILKTIAITQKPELITEVLNK